MSNPSPNLEELLRGATWARRLARHLVRQQQDADDLLQEAWLVANAKAAKGEHPSRPWLSGVLRVLGMNQTRAAARRRHRESETDAGRAAADERATPEGLLNQVQTQRRLSEALLALDEPYRTTVLLRYYEELSAAAIARRMQVPAGTVRWRLKEGLDRLRRALDDGAADRQLFALALVNFAGGPVRSGVPRMWAGGGVVAVGAAVVAAVAFHHAGSDPDPSRVLSDNPTIRNRVQPVPRKDSDMKTSIAALAAAATLAAQPVPGTSAAPQAVPASKVPRFQVPLGVGPIQGPASAKVTLLAFMDYQSPFCVQASKTIATLLAAHPGQLRYQVIHRPLPFHRDAAYATRAAFAAAEQGKFWEMHATLLQNHTALKPADIEGYAKKVGLDLARFRTDIVGPTVTNRADLEEANAQSVKVAAVPSFFLNGRLIAGAQPLAVFQQAVAEEISHADAVLKAGVRPADLYTTITAGAAAELPGPAIAFGEESSPGPGTLAFKATHKLLSDNVSVANACFEDGRNHRSDLAGRVVIDVRLTRGAQPRVLLHESSLNFPKVDNCIVQALRKLTYPELKTGGPIVARHLFSFPPAPAGPAPQ